MGVMRWRRGCWRRCRFLLEWEEGKEGKMQGEKMGDI